ncbi:MAG TPA: succinate--CoA ligase subunit alpha [Anaerolineaceae bacterium]|uniref:Succinate--CoA ligase [ADP-forming] subunit alpha n=1 Tax=Anaerolinea thermophila TaxID=167964 RepID=A0A117LH80_9CHLR|nr:MAG: sucD [Anaerolinea thermophila]HAF62190.1 succinate--CoA ligase subunit alpha [Anaerolineaceae bacterium]
MSILINSDTRVLVQGITGEEGLYHSELMRNYGTKIVAGVTPRKGGDWVLDEKVPVFDTVQTAVKATGADVSVIFVPAKFAFDSIYEAIDSQIPLVVCITEGIPAMDMLKIKSILRTSSTIMIGPNSPGLITPGACKVGIIPGNITEPGNIGVVSRSGTLTYEVLYALKQNKLGVSTCVGIGGDAIIGSGFTDILVMFDQDPNTEKVVLIGEIGGKEEDLAADFIATEMTKPVVAYIAGRTAPKGKRMGHAGAIIEGRAGSAAQKIELFRKAGVKVAEYPEDIPALL